MWCMSLCLKVSQRLDDLLRRLSNSTMSSAFVPPPPPSQLQSEAGSEDVELGLLAERSPGEGVGRIFTATLTLAPLRRSAIWGFSISGVTGDKAAMLISSATSQVRCDSMWRRTSSGNAGTYADHKRFLDSQNNCPAPGNFF